MRLVRNTGNDRVIDLVRPLLKKGVELGVVSATISASAFAELLSELKEIESCHLHYWALLQIDLRATDSRPAG